MRDNTQKKDGIRKGIRRIIRLAISPLIFVASVVLSGIAYINDGTKPAQLTFWFGCILAIFMEVHCILQEFIHPEEDMENG